MFYHPFLKQFLPVLLLWPFLTTFWPLLTISTIFFYFWPFFTIFDNFCHVCHFCPFLPIFDQFWEFVNIFAIFDHLCHFSHFWPTEKKSEKSKVFRKWGSQVVRKMVICLTRPRAYWQWRLYFNCIYASMSIYRQMCFKKINIANANICFTISCFYFSFCCSCCQSQSSSPSLGLDKTVWTSFVSLPKT